MAGKRQHYLPRLLQRGFLAETSDEAERTWLHRRDTTARLVGISDIGVSPWFYSRKSTDGSPTLDDAITEYERDLGRQVRKLREAPPRAPIDASLAAETVIHLTMRTQHLRSVIGSGVTSIVGEVEALCTDPARLGSMIGLTGPAMADAVNEGIRRNAAELVPAGIPASFSERLFAAAIREYGDQLIENVARTFVPILPRLFGDLAEHIRDAHNRIVAEPLFDQGWVKTLSKFKWRIVEAGELILPDAVALSRESNGPLEPLLFTSGSDTELVMMPVAWNRMLIGQRVTATVDISNFNLEAARACEQFFIARRAFDVESLSGQIGSSLAARITDTIEEVVREAIEARTLSATTISPVEPYRVIEREFSYNVRLADFGDEALTKQFADILHQVVSALARDLPLQDLDGVTIALDYEAALTNLDRGDPALPPATSGALSYGVGVAKPVPVIRDGKWKEHLVIAEGLAACWASDDLKLRAYGLRTLVKMLAGIAHSTRYQAASGTGFDPDPMTRVLHPAMSTAPSGYWSARQAAFIAPDHGIEDADAVIEALEHAQRAMGAARAAMTDQSDVGAASICALECASAVLAHVADWLGHRDGLAEGQHFVGDDLPERLKPYGLSQWIELFGRDLAACYRDDGALDFNVVTTLSRHVERLFWALGVYCWQEGNDVRCIISDQPLIFPDQLF